MKVETAERLAPIWEATPDRIERIVRRVYRERARSALGEITSAAARQRFVVLLKGKDAETMYKRDAAAVLAAFAQAYRNPQPGYAEWIAARRGF